MGKSWIQLFFYLDTVHCSLYGLPTGEYKRCCCHTNIQKETVLVANHSQFSHIVWTILVTCGCLGSSHAVARVINYEVVHLPVLLLDLYNSRHSQCALLTSFPDHTGVPSPAWPGDEASTPHKNKFYMKASNSDKQDTNNFLYLPGHDDVIPYFGGWTWLLEDGSKLIHIILRNDISMNSITISILSLQMWWWPCTMKYMLNVDV